MGKNPESGKKSQSHVGKNPEPGKKSLSLWEKIPTEEKILQPLEHFPH
jgi:hypothetical protein